MILNIGLDIREPYAHKKAVSDRTEELRTIKGVARTSILRNVTLFQSLVY